MTRNTHTLQPRLRLKAGDVIAMGPGKAQLLELIRQHNSISAAARAMNMSYRRAWLLVDTMNSCFREPLVVTATGGSRGGGARLSPLGERVLTLFRHFESALAARPELEELSALLADRDKGEN